MNGLRHSMPVIAASTLAVLTGIFGRLGAQEPGEGEHAGPDVVVRSETAMPGQDQITWVESNMGTAKTISYHVQNMLDQARKEKDTIKITCLDDKLTQIRVNLKGIEGRAQSLKTAVQANDATSANQQFTILRIYFSRIEGLKAEAENCLGEVDVVLGETETTMTIDDDITANDPSEDISTFIDTGLDPMPHASGYY
jgi:hypothetical protein